MLIQNLKLHHLIIFLSTWIGFAICSHAEITPDWTPISTEPFELIEPVNIVNPVLTASDVDDIDARFVADPFLFFENGSWFMFFEALNAETNQGDIALATSNDGFHWTYEQVILDESFHISYPYMFKWENEYYMVPETKRANSIRLYKALQFPYEWELESTLLEDIQGADSSLFRYNDKWWMFTTREWSSLYLYHADDLKGPWIEHDMNPIILDDLAVARSGGRSFVFDNERIIRIAQKGDLTYGQQVRAFEVD